MELDDLVPMLRYLEREGFYGLVELRFIGGKLNVIHKSETLKTLSNKPSSDKRGSYERSTKQ
jgi:hypothetical protein